VPVTLQDGQIVAFLYTEGDVPARDDGYPVVVVVKGTTGFGGVPVDTPMATTGFGYLQVYVNIPEDHRGAESRAAVGATTRYAAGLEADAEGCMLTDRVTVDVSGLAPIVFGNSNGGNLAVGALADDAAAMPPIAGLVMFESPVSAQFTDVELGAKDRVNAVYHPGTCRFDVGVGMTCPFPDDAVLGWDPAYQDRDGGPMGAVYFDVDEDGLLGLPDYPMFGVEVDDVDVAFSPELTALIEAQGLVGPDRVDAAGSDTFWAERDASRLAAAAFANQPEVPLISIGTTVDHVAGVPDHAHITGAAEIWRQTGFPWARVNPASTYMVATAGEGPAWTDNEPNLETFLNNPDVLMEPDELDADVPPDAYCAAGILELIDRAL
jgi:hypothetical protein